MNDSLRSPLKIFAQNSRDVSIPSQNISERYGTKFPNILVSVLHSTGVAKLYRITHFDIKYFIQIPFINFFMRLEGQKKAYTIR